MVGFILSLLGLATITFLSFSFGAVMCFWGAYEKIKEKHGKLEADAFVNFMKKGA